MSSTGASAAARICGSRAAPSALRSRWMSASLAREKYAFLEKQEEPLCEVKVKFTNIRGENDEILPVVQKCDILKQYCEFMEIVSRYKAELKEQPTDEEMRICIDKAISEAISRNILADYLTRNGTEVRNMLQAEYDYDLDMQVKAQEAREEKAIEDAKRMLLKKYSTDDIVEISGLPLEKVLELQKEISVQA